MRMRRFEPRPFEELAVAIVVKPILVGFKACNNRMMRRRMVLRGMLTWGRIAATYMTALGAATKMQPPASCRRALDATGSARLRFQRDSASIRVHDLLSLT